MLLELIDTWWDVNFFIRDIQITPLRELIDTWWDVNNTNTIINIKQVRINRYMVGCKYHKAVVIRKLGAN